MSWFQKRRRPETLKTHTRRAIFDFVAVLFATTAVIFVINVAAAQAVPIPVFSLILPFDFGLTQSAIAVIHGGLAGADTAPGAPAATTTGPSGLAMTLACALFAALSAGTLLMYRQLKSAYAWRWSAHFD